MTSPTRQEPNQPVIRPAASLLVLRDGESGLEVIALQRAKSMRFLPGYLAFPGGAVDLSDRGFPEHLRRGTVHASAADDDVPFAIGALRECMEEAGLLCGVYTSDGPAGEIAVPMTDQLALLRSTMSLASILDKHGWGVDMGALRFVGRWVTPRSMPARFDTRFFVVQSSPSAVQPRACGTEENEWIRWANPARLLASLAAGTARAVPPTIAMLTALARCSTAAEAWQSISVPGPSPEPD